MTTSSMLEGGVDRNSFVYCRVLDSRMLDYCFLFLWWQRHDGGISPSDSSPVIAVLGLVTPVEAPCLALWLLVVAMAGKKK